MDRFILLKKGKINKNEPIEGEDLMRTVIRGLTKFFLANVMVVFAIMLLPVFLFTDDVAIFNDILDYLFSNKS